MIQINTDAQKLNLKSPHILLATWFGSGFLLPAPGTWGSLAAIPIGLLILWLGNPSTLLISTLFIFILGLWCTRRFQRETQTHDSKIIVIDEVAGQWIPLMFCGLNFFSIVAAFALFRFFDILKPFPISWLDEKLDDEWGVMLDDVIAGTFAAMSLIVLQWIF